MPTDPANHRPSIQARVVERAFVLSEPRTALRSGLGGPQGVAHRSGVDVGLRGRPVLAILDQLGAHELVGHHRETDGEHQPAGRPGQRRPDPDPEVVSRRHTPDRRYRRRADQRARAPRRARFGRVLAVVALQHRVQVGLVVLERLGHVEERLGGDREELRRCSWRRRAGAAAGRRPRAAPRRPRCTPRPIAGAASRSARRGVPSTMSSRMSSLWANSWNTTLWPLPGFAGRALRPGPTRAAPGRGGRAPRRAPGSGPSTRVPDDRAAVEAARPHRRRVHDDGAHLAVLVDVEAEHEQGGLGRDRHGDPVVEGEAVGRLPVLVAQQPVAQPLEEVAFVVVEQLPDGDVGLDDLQPVVGEALAAVQHLGQSTTHPPDPPGAVARDRPADPG